jgi:hypothetical protein
VIVMKKSGLALTQTMRETGSSFACARYRSIDILLPWHLRCIFHDTTTLLSGKFVVQ